MKKYNQPTTNIDQLGVNVILQMHEVSNFKYEGSPTDPDGNAF